MYLQTSKGRWKKAKQTRKNARKKQSEKQTCNSRYPKILLHDKRTFLDHLMEQNVVETKF